MKTDQEQEEDNSKSAEGCTLFLFTGEEPMLKPIARFQTKEESSEFFIKGMSSK